MKKKATAVEITQVSFDFDWQMTWKEINQWSSVFSNKVSALFSFIVYCLTQNRMIVDEKLSENSAKV